MSEPLGAHCPGCGGPPLLDSVLPYFCADPDCRVLGWEPTATLAEFTAQAKVVDLSGWTEPPGDDAGGGS